MRRSRQMCIRDSINTIMGNATDDRPSLRATVICAGGESCGKRFDDQGIQTCCLLYTSGLPITLVSAAITTMSFMGFGGLVENIINAIF